MPYDMHTTMPRDASNFMSRNQMLHRCSPHSSNASNSSRRGSARILKPVISGLSPHNIQRRRTTASYPVHQGLRPPHDSLYQTRERRLQDYYSARYAMPEQRPMSWHPGSESLQHSYPQPVSHDPAIGNTISGLENLDVTGTPAATVEQSIQDAMSMAYGFPINNASQDYTQTPTFQQDSASVDPMSRLDQPFSSTPYPQADFSGLYQYPFVSDDSTRGSFDLPNDRNGYQVSDEQPHPQPTHIPTLSYPSQETASVWQDSTATDRSTNQSAAQQPSKDTKELLIGIGLHDNPSTSNASDKRASLKLEETWEPPNHQNAVEDDSEQSSSDEADEVDEMPIMVPQQPQPTFLPATYNDLSEQSFFFSNDNHLSPENGYGDFFTYGQGLHMGQPKAQVADAGPGSSWWYS